MSPSHGGSGNLLFRVAPSLLLLLILQLLSRGCSLLVTGATCLWTGRQSHQESWLRATHASTLGGEHREQLFEEVLTRHLETLALATRCTRALIYLQSEKDQLLQVVCRFPSDCLVSRDEEYVPRDYQQSSSDNSKIRNVGQLSLVLECPIVHTKESDYFGILRVAFDAPPAANTAAAAAAAAESWRRPLQGGGELVENMVTSTARSLASAIKLEHMHYAAAADAESLNSESGGIGSDGAYRSSHPTSYFYNEDGVDDDDDIFSGIWMTASNSIKTMRTMLKMLARRNIQDGDDIGRETYDNIQLQLESIGNSISPLRRPRLYSSASSADGLLQDDPIDDLDELGDIEPESESVPEQERIQDAVPLILKRSDLWTNNQVESTIDFDEEGADNDI